MMQMGAKLKRKSYEKLDPTMPQSFKQKRQVISGQRTKYNQLEEQLEQFTRRNITLPTTQYQAYDNYKQQSNFNQKQDSKDIQSSSKKTLTTNAAQNSINLENARFHDDHHNIQSISQLIGKGTGNFITPRITIPEKDQLNKKESVAQNSEEKEQGQQQLPEKDSSDYVQMQLEEEQNPYIEPYVKKYSRNNVLKIQQSYKPLSQSQIRMEQRYWNSQRKKIIQKHQDQQIINFLQEYQKNKQQLRIKQLKKAESNRIIKQSKVFGAYKNQKFQNFSNNIERSLSMPVIKPKKQIKIDLDDDALERQVKKQQQSNPYFKNPQELKKIEHKVMISMSVARFSFAKNKGNKTKQSTSLQTQITEVQCVQKALREKGIIFNPKDIRNSLINIRNHGRNQKDMVFPTKQLFENQFYKRNPL